MENDLRPDKNERLLRTLAHVQPPAAMNDRLVRSLRHAEAERTWAGKSLRWSVPATVWVGVMIAVLGSVLRQERILRMDRNQSELMPLLGRPGLNTQDQLRSAPDGELRPVLRSRRKQRERQGGSVPTILRIQPMRLDKNGSPPHDRALKDSAEVNSDAVLPSRAGAAAPTGILPEASTPGSTLPGFKAGIAPGVPLPRIADAVTPGLTVPPFDIAKTPGTPLPTFAEAIQNGENP